eukprot:CAMPEP_0168442698 /NCGR_PEP_ID=MMETSP0228-20121227/44147_1 /TAXON_ID=133427 /ORGANISM="Protoceratium reticulatum, Strain CCCM 535 (=CCMP 1889)" /LENGTH=33 /DNA_ID= /DNA_START= /DNA_END= /DNA_ORIENTATION=
MRKPRMNVKPPRILAPTSPAATASFAAEEWLNK